MKEIEQIMSEEKFILFEHDCFDEWKKEKLGSWSSFFYKRLVKSIEQYVIKASEKHEKFFDWCIQQSFEGMDIDGGDLQDQAEKLGLIVLCVIPEDKLEEYPHCLEYDTNEMYFYPNSDEAKKWKKNA